MMAQTPGAEARTGLKLISPTAIYVILLLAVPLATVLIYSVLTGGRGNVSLPFTFENYAELWSKSVYGYIMFKSLMVALVVTAITVLLAYPVAYFVSFHVKPERKSLWLFLITIPFWTNLLIRTFAINEVIRNEGILNTVLIWLGVIETPLQINYTETAVLIGMTYVYLPLMVLPLYATIERFDMRLLEASYDLYASRWTTLRRVILPIVKPGIIAGSILVFVPSLGAYVTPRILGGGKNMMIGNFIELQFLQGKNWPLGASLSVALLVIVMAALLIYVRVANRDRSQGHG
jgi:spermidine/putrescine transport system permease protein